MLVLPAILFHLFSFWLAFPWTPFVSAARISRDTELTLTSSDLSPWSLNSKLEERGFGSSAEASVSVSAETSDTKGKSAQLTAGQEVVAFMQVLQHAEIKSQACWINLVNATQSPIGTCLQLPALASLLVTDTPLPFATVMSGYLSSMCAQAQCAQSIIDVWKPAFEYDCGTPEDRDTPFIKSLSTILNLYSSALRNLACDITFNGTSTNCLAENLASTSTTNDRTFFLNLLSGINLDWYTDSFFKVQWCTGCYHEFYKAAMFLIPSLQQNDQVKSLGETLSSCTQPAGLYWPGVCDRAKPNALLISAQTKASIGTTGKASSLDVKSSLTIRIATTIVVSMVSLLVLSS